MEKNSTHWQMKADLIEPEPELRLRLIAAPDDPALSSPEYQKELRDFYQALESEGVEASPIRYAHDAVGGGGGLTREFTLIVTTLAPIVAAAAAVAGAWLHAKYGRKLRVKFGDIEGEAPRLEELEKAVRLVEECQQRNRPRVIHEP